MGTEAHGTRPEQPADADKPEAAPGNAGPANRTVEPTSWPGIS
ncbi:hypothetical protein [Actinocatenispora rupis]|nr:hypothetical protein [Actinocatenispora rupis]